MQKDFKGASGKTLTSIGNEKTPEATAALRVRYAELITGLAPAELDQFATVVWATSLNGIGEQLEKSDARF